MPAQRVVLAEYFTVEDRTLLFIVREDFEQPLVQEIPIGTETIQNFVKKYFQEKKVKDWNEQDEQDYQDCFSPFVAPLVCESPKGDLMTQENDIIWFVPHNFLHYLPLHALKVGDRYLIERNPVCYTPSASVMKYCHQKRKDKREKALIFADSRTTQPDEQLLHAQIQAQVIKQLFNDPPAELYIGDEVTKDLLKRKLQESKKDIDILHIACHGVFNSQEALKSGIKFAKKENLTDEEKLKDEEILTAEQIFSLEMNADLVTLSACESGINDNKPGDELIGLTRALIYAGTPSVLVSLWSVDEISTSILMSRFYQKLKEGLNKTEALQQAQLEVQRITVQEVIDYCEAAKHQINNPVTQQLLDVNIADMRFNAKDFKLALHSYNQILKNMDIDTKDYRIIKKKLTQCKLARNYQVDYTTLVYDSIYYWAPFLLVGDWR
ncbi:CHAT domain-containing protein [Nostoc sp. ChiVER01]|uniref:CHAT domain-containing protein n=1 Tax=Nostoc sp. ChiVER01 TaxID=3075382 RepID=UPI002AD27A2B|nr:CHAT domain-containing protein [Nostoc sp. ChiVER01]MDZ8226732.1 CHAT domain-containing protein [Nostoc sp. ChiVER01]